jgi:glycosyltransferase involved in cell wall biosynthesis
MTKLLSAHSVRAVKGTPLRIAMLAPPWIEIPPAGYGGIEQVVDLLCRELVQRGHAVTLFAAPGTNSTATVRPLLDRTHPDAIGAALFEADHVALAFEEIDSAAATGVPFDLVHDHSGFTALAMADRITTPVLHTLHGPFSDDTSRFYARHGQKAAIVAISRWQLARAPRGLGLSAVIPNPIDLDSWPLRRCKDDYLLWIGRMSADKGPQRAIDAARRAGRRLVLAGPIQPGQEGFFENEVRPWVDGEQVQFVGEVGGPRKQQLFARAMALLMPIRWPEPFGMVMVEALACGTPVIAFPEGAASEIVIDGENGFLVEDEAEMAGAVAELGDLDPSHCRASASRYAADGIAARYESVYRELASPRRIADDPSVQVGRPAAASVSARRGERPRAKAGAVNSA